MSESGDSTPGQKALVAMKEIHKEIVFKVPATATKKRRKQKVLDEDTYVEELGKIIQRDFFPDLEKLQAQHDYLEAVDKNDVIKIRELHLKYSGSKTPSVRAPSPATFETPANIHNSDTPRTPHTPSETPPVIEIDKPDRTLSLDQYLNSHTSEDNESFEGIMEESDKRHRQKFSYLYNEEEKSEEDQRKLLALPTIEQQAALPEKKLNIDTWGYKNRNYIMYVPDGVGLTREEELEMSKRRQEIVHGNTRLGGNPFNELANKETITELAKQQAKILDGKIGVDGKELVTASPKVNGFSFMRSPSPCPGVAQSPLMTWGEVEGTPFKLDGSDTPIHRAQGPSFKMSEPPKREQLAIALAEKASERHRDKKKKAIDAARRHFASPSPRPHTSSIDRLSSMSPAARRLATSRLRLGAESSALRSTYSPSPVRRTPKTPAAVATPKLKLGIKKHDDHLTDDLLQINVPKRQSAADFF